MKKRILSLALALALCLGLAVPTVAAEKTVVTTAEELQAAFDKGGEVVLGSDIGSETTLTVTKSTSLDLNGYKLTIMANEFLETGLTIGLAQTLTISDSRYTKLEPGTGKLYASGETGIMTSGATLIINSGVVEATGRWSAGIGASGEDGYYDGGTVVINGGTVELLSSGLDAKKLTLKSCTITGDGAGDYKGSYDMSGNKITVRGASGWAEEGVAAAIARNLVPLSLQSSYVQPTTRAEFCALGVAFYEAVTGAEITERKTFSDTDDVNVQKMGALGVVSGVGGDRFDPNGTLTREQAATMLARLAEAAGTPLPQSMTSFADKEQISPWARSAVGQVQAAGVMGGTGNNQFSPPAPYTREQSMITTSRLFDVVK